MSSATLTPQGPVSKALGHSMTRLQQKYRALREQLTLEDRIKPATIVNLSPFTLRVNCPLVSFHVPAKLDGDEYSYVTIAEPRFYFPYRGEEKSADGMGSVNNYDVNVVLPIQQANEFYRVYMQTPEDLAGGVMGGVVIFEGGIDVLEKYLDKPDPKTTVKVPFLKLLEDGQAFVGTRSRLLEEVWNEAQEALRNRTMAMLQQASEWYIDPKMQKNIVRPHHLYAKLAVEKHWRDELPEWTQKTTRTEDLCPRCKKSVASDAYMCPCGKVLDALEAYRNGDIEFGHVSFDLLNKDQWAEARKIKAAREKARGDKSSD